MLRRLLWLLPMLFLVSVLAFQFLVWTLPSQKSAPTDEIPRQVPTPVFFNAEPQNAGDLAITLMQRVARAGPDQREAARYLAQLGGAALPHVLPRLDQLNPAERARVSLALRPVALRMGLGSEFELSDPESASVFWTRFWQDRQFDFRPAVVRRLVARLSQRSLTLRKDDIIQLDTYALPDLIRAFGRIDDQEDIARVERLDALLCHITRKTTAQFPGNALERARQRARAWRSWWLSHGESYVSLDGIAKAIASLTQTKYGKWVRGVRLGLGTHPNGATVWSTLKASYAVTLLLLCVGAAGGYLCGAAFAAASVIQRGRYERWGGWFAMGLVCAPLGTLVLSRTSTAGSMALGLWLMLCFGAGTAYLYQHSASQSARRHAWWPNAPLTATKVRASLGQSAATSLALFGSSLPTLLLVSALIEHTLTLDGLTRTTVLALGAGDVDWLMAMALLGTVMAGVLQLLGDTLTNALAPKATRVSTELARRWT